MRKWTSVAAFTLSDHNIYIHTHIHTYTSIHTHPLIYLGFINGCITLHSSPVHIGFSSADALYIRCSFCSPFLSASVSFTPKIFVSSSSSHSSRSFWSMSRTAQVSPSSLTISPLMTPALFSFFFKGNPRWGSIFEIQTSASPLPNCSGNFKEFGRMFPPQ